MASKSVEVDLEPPLGISSLNIASRQPSEPAASPNVPKPKLTRSGNAHKILYPIRNFDGNSSPATIKWAGLSALDMVEQVVKMALGSSKLQSMTTFDHNVHSGYSVLQYLAGESAGDDAHAGHKRKHESFDEDYEEDSVGCELVAGSVLDDRSNFNADLPDTELVPWEPFATLEGWNSSVHQVSGLDINSISKLKRLNFLVESFEQLAVEPKNKWCIPSYNRIKSMFSSNMTSLATNGSVHHLLLDQAVHQMKALMEMVDPTAPKTTSRVKFTEFVSCNDGSKQLMSEPEPTRIMNGITLSTSPMSEKAKRTVFNAYMTEWLCQTKNWANPYPDETLLRQMASHFIHLGCIPGVEHSAVVTETEAISKITNWLVNTRTRQWRPAIEQAFDAKRPTMLLMEDSIRIFTNFSLRPLIGWDSDKLFANLGDYSMKTWGKKGGSKSNAKKADCISSNALGDHTMKPSSESINMINDDVPSLFPQAQGAIESALDEYGFLLGNCLVVNDVCDEEAKPTAAA